MRVTGNPRQRAAQALRNRPNPPEDEQLAKALRREAALRTVREHGCADCYGALYTEANGLRLLCGRLIDGVLDGMPRERVAGCGVPRLYQAVMANARDVVTEEDVLAVRPLPDLDDEETPNG